MKKIIIIIIVILPNCIFSQKTVVYSQGGGLKIVNKSNVGFSFNYYYQDFESLVDATFNLSTKKNLDKSTYENINLNILSKNGVLGELYFIDSIPLNKNLGFEDYNNIISNILSNNYLKDFEKNKYGLYYFNVNCDINFYQNILMNYKIQISDRFLFLECKQNLNFSISESDLPEFDLTGMDFYNSKTIGISNGSYLNINGVPQIDDRFRRSKAYNQLSYIAILNDIRIKVKKYFQEYGNEISEQKYYLDIK